MPPPPPLRTHTQTTLAPQNLTPFETARAKKDRERGKESKAVENKEWERGREGIRESMGSLSSKNLFIFKLASPTVRRHSQISPSLPLCLSFTPSLPPNRVERGLS